MHVCTRVESHSRETVLYLPVVLMYLCVKRFTAGSSCLAGVREYRSFWKVALRVAIQSVFAIAIGRGIRRLGACYMLVYDSRAYRILLDCGDGW